MTFDETKHLLEWAVANNVQSIQIGEISMVFGSKAGKTDSFVPTSYSDFETRKKLDTMLFGSDLNTLAGLDKENS